MAELRTYKDFADNSYAYFMFAYDNGQIFNEMGAMAQSICERYLKHLIAEYAEPENDSESDIKERALRSHKLRVLSNFLRHNMELPMSKTLVTSLNSVNGFYFSTRYPGEDSTTLTREELDECAEAIQLCKEYVEDTINQLGTTDN